MKSKLRISIAAIIFLIFSGCSSPLEDIEITDFNLIRAKFIIEKEINSNGIINDNIEVVIEDKNYMNFELKGATITVNDIKMDYDNSLLGKKYTVELPVDFNKDYTFEIILANGEKVKTKLTTPYIDYKSIKYPKTIIIGEDYKIKWNKQNEPVTIYFVLNTDSKEDNKNYYFNKTLQNGKGKIIIPGNETSSYKQAKTCYFNLSYKNETEISQELRGGEATVEITYRANDISIQEN